MLSYGVLKLEVNDTVKDVLLVYCVHMIYTCVKIIIDFHRYSYCV